MISPANNPSNQSDPVSEHEERLNAALVKYLEATECGTAPDRETLLATYPDLAADLSDFLSARDQVSQFSQPFRRTARSTRVIAEHRHFGDYELYEEIGRGGMGVVYKAWQRSLDRLVAVKMIHPRCRGTAADLQRFRKESEAAAQLDHPHIVPVYEVGEHDGQLYFSMKLIDGGSLATLRPTSMDVAHLRRVVELMVTIARAIHHAHQRGVLHRDLKPSNILLHSDGRPYIADFGLAKQLHADNEVTETGDVLGTPAYMSPEQAAVAAQMSFACADTIVRGSTTATDIYGVGAILYSVLTGQPPFQSASAIYTLALVQERDPTPPSRLNPLVDRDLEAICLKCLEKDPTCRYRSAELLAEDLENWLNGEPTLARPISRLNRAGRWCRRNPVLALLTGSVALLLIAGIAAMTVGLIVIDRQRQTAERLRQETKDQAGKLQQRLYVAQMVLGFKHFERAELDELQAVLHQFRPGNGEQETDLRGFEWYYLSRLAKTKPKIIADYQGHQGTVFCANFSPDGKLVVSCGEDRSIQIWEAATGEPRKILRPDPATEKLPLKGHKSDENYVDFSPDSRYLASCCEDGTVRLWDLATDTWQPLLPKHEGEVLSLDFSPDGQWLATAGVDRVIRLWNIASKKLEAELTGHSHIISCVRFSDDGRTLISAGHDMKVQIWDTATRSIRSTTELDRHVHSIALSPDEEYFAAGTNRGDVQLWHVSGKIAQSCGKHTTSVRSIDFSPRGDFLASTGDSCVRVWSLSNRSLGYQFDMNRGTSWCVRFAADGRRLVTASNGGKTTVWALPQHTSLPNWNATILKLFNQIAIAPVRRTSKSVVAPVARHRIAMSTETGEICLSELGTDAFLQTLPVQAAGYSSIAFTDDGRELAFVGVDGSIRTWSIDHGHERTVFPSRGSSPAENEVYMWGISRIRLAYLTKNRLLVAYGDGVLKIIDGERIIEPAVYPSRGHWIGPSLALAADRKTVALFDDPNDHVYLWDTESHSLLARLPVKDFGRAAAFSPDGKLLAVGDGSGGISIVNAQTGQVQSTLVAHQRMVSAIAFSPDGKTIASGDGDGTVRLWHAATNQELFVLEDRQGRSISSLAFSSDGRALVVTGHPRIEDGSTVSIFSCDVPSEVE